MNELLVGLLGALLSTNPVTEVSNVVARQTGVVLPVIDPKNPKEQEFRRIMEADDAAQAEVDRWIRESDAAKDQGAEFSRLTLNARIEQRFQPVLKSYEDFIARNPEHARVRLAYGSFLNDLGRDAEAQVQWEKARELDPNNPAAWNNLADYYSHRGPVRKAFEYLDKAISLNRSEPVYYQNLATLVFLFRKDAMEIYRLDDEQKVFRRAIDLYMRARKLDPENLTYATDVAQVYYYLKPPQLEDKQEAQAAATGLVDEALTAWLEAQKLARTGLERQGIAIHLARVCLNHGRFEAARKHLAGVTDPVLADLKQRLMRNLDEKEKAKASAPTAQ